MLFVPVLQKFRREYVLMYFLWSIIERGMHISLDAREGNQNLRVLLSYHLESR